MNTSQLHAVLETIPQRVVACSGGVDSTTLAVVAHRADPGATTIAHTVTPAVPAEATARVVHYASIEGWQLELVRSKEFDDERYLANPTDRCYFCKSNLYSALAELAPMSPDRGHTLLSGANTDDLGEYRPGLRAADEHDVRHPYLEANMSKHDVRAAARELGLDVADIPASPCLASRLYTGTRVTPARLQAIELGEATVRRITGVSIVRCRIRDEAVLLEISEVDRCHITAEVLAAVGRAMSSVCGELARPELDPRPYQPGRAILEVT